MDNAQAQIEELKQEVALLRKQRAQSEARMLTCLVQAKAEILAYQTDLAIFKEAVAKDMTKSSADRKKRHDIVVEEMTALWKNSQVLDNAIIDIHLFLWPIVESIFPNLLKQCHVLSKRFKEPGLYSEAKSR